MRGHQDLKICYILSYCQPNYIRTRTLLNAFESMDNVHVFKAINKDSGIVRYLQTIISLLKIRINDPDVYVIGFRGHELMPLIYALVKNKPIIFDAMMSPWAALYEEKKIGSFGYFLAWFWKPFERYILHQADWILTDTNLHAEFYHQEFNLPKHKIIPIPVGAIEPENEPAPQPVKSDSEPLKVLFYGSFLPLHGIPVIVQSAAMVSHLPIYFHFIGGKPKQVNQLHSLCKQLRVKNYSHNTWEPMQNILNQEIPQADICLGGPFGGTPQARRVVTGKSSQSLALGRVTLIGAINADYGLKDKENCLLIPQADPNALADALCWANDNRSLLPKIALKGRQLYSQQLSIQAITNILEPCIMNIRSNV